MAKDRNDTTKYWNQREKKRPFLLFLLLTSVCMLLAYFVSRTAG